MHPLINIAVRAARSASQVIVRAMHRLESLEITNKSHNDFVTEVDYQAEQAIIDVIRKAYPDHGILAEEGGNREGDEYQWIIDPLDGTTNYLHGFPQFAVSIGIKHRDRLSHGVVYDPLREELFTASRGEGAQLNSKRIRVSKRPGLEGALLGTGFPFRDQKYLDAYLKTLATLITQTAGIRRPGSAALDLAYVAAGRLDGFWEIGLKPWDVAAGAVIIQEAGGLVGDFSGDSNFLDNGNVVAGNPKLFKAILQAIRPHLPDSLL